MADLKNLFNLVKERKKQARPMKDGEEGGVIVRLDRRAERRLGRDRHLRRQGRQSLAASKDRCQDQAICQKNLLVMCLIHIRNALDRLTLKTGFQKPLYQ